MASEICPRCGRHRFQFHNALYKYSRLWCRDCDAVELERIRKEAQDAQDRAAERRSRVSKAKAALKRAGLSVATLQPIRCCPSQRMPRGGDFEVRAVCGRWSEEIGGVEVSFCGGARVFGPDRVDNDRAEKLMRAAAACSGLSFVKVNI